jgi:hypothetical protein
MTKDYDSTLARIAGNIASGLCDHYTEHGEPRSSETAQDEVCYVAMRMARKIVELCREDRDSRIRAGEVHAAH